MRIGFTGAQGSGKTTLVEMFVKENPEYNRMFNFHRHLNSEFNLGINNVANFETQFAISAFIASEPYRYEKYIADRTSICNFAYAESCLEISKEQNEYMKNTFKDGLKKYDVIFYTPIEFIPPEDGVRIVDLDYRNFIDKTIVKIIDEVDIKHKIVTLSGSIEERYKTLKSVLNQIKQNKL